MDTHKQPHATLTGVPVKTQSQGLLDTFGFNTILGRFLFTAFVLIAATVTFAWLSQQKVDGTSTLNTHNLTSRVAMSHSLRELSNLLWQTEMDFQQNLLVPSEISKQQVLHDVEEIHSRISLLMHEQWISEHPAVHKPIQQLSVTADAIRTQIKKVLELRADPTKVFPYISIMVNELNPLNIEFNGSVTVAINEVVSDDAPTTQQLHSKELFNELRYLWLQRINIFRIFSSNRFGVFVHSSEISLNAAIADMATYENRINTVFAQLQDLQHRNQLGFEQTSALADLQRIHSRWNLSYAKVKAILLSNDGWRTDIPLLRDKVNPLFIDLWGQFRAIQRQVEQRAVEDINSTTAVADNVSTQLWLLTLIVVVVAMFGTLIFETQIRRPITRVIRALRAEAEGETNIVLPESNIAEAQELSQAFTQMREQIHNRQEHLQAILTYSAEAILTVNNLFFIESFNPAAEKLFGYAASEVLGKNVNVLVPSPHQENHDEYINRAIDSADKILSGKVRELTALHQDGTELEITLQITEMYVGGRKLYLALAADNRERRNMLEEIRAREQRLQSILDNTAEGIITFNYNGHIETWNRAAEILFGWDVEEVIGTHLSRYLSFDEIDNPYCPIGVAPEFDVRRYVGQETEVFGQARNGGVFPLSLKLSRMMHDGASKYTAVIANIAERKAMMENLRNMAEHDSLTGLFNRAYFHAVLDRTVTEVKENLRPHCALFYLDLDNFKYVNDTLGHAAGDKLIVEVSKLLIQRTRRSDLVARLGGDEFVVLVNQANLEQIPKIAESFRLLLAEYAFHFNGRTVDIGCSIGVAIITQEMGSSSEVMSQADLACHLAKRGGRNRVHIFTRENDQDVHTMSIDIGWSRRIKQALEHNRFVLAAQPIVDTQHRNTVSFEILLRMLDEDGTVIMPAGFLPTAERFGLSAEIDAWVIRHAIQHLAYVRSQGANIRYALNLSGQSITAPLIAELIPAMLHQTGLEPAALTFEITETAAIGDMTMATTLLSHLRSLGCQTALDDFGSGMSSFAYLRELPVDIVKIDGRFVRNLAENNIDQAMVKAMNEIAHAMGKQTVAEFVEAEIHFQVLRELGVDFGQGYYLGKPALLDISMILASQTKRKLVS